MCPLVNMAGSCSKIVGSFVEHNRKDHATKHKSFIQDTPDFLRHIRDINEGQLLPENTLLVTIDAIGCYMNIPQDEGVK